MVQARHESEWWQTSYLLAATMNLMQTDASALVSPASVNPMSRDRAQREKGILLTGEEFEAAFKKHVAGRRTGS